ncbi:hypothetical protein DFAR_660013 [Desulfarculales bacterium]
MPEQDSIKLKAVLPLEGRRGQRSRDFLGHLMEAYCRLKTLAGGRRGTEWLLDAGLGLLLSAVIIYQSLAAGRTAPGAGGHGASGGLSAGALHRLIPRVGPGDGPRRGQESGPQLGPSDNGVWLSRG